MSCGLVWRRCLMGTTCSCMARIGWRRRRSGRRAAAGVAATTCLRRLTGARPFLVPLRNHQSCMTAIVLGPPVQVCGGVAQVAGRPRRRRPGAGGAGAPAGGQARAAGPIRAAHAPLPTLPRGAPALLRGLKFSPSYRHCLQREHWWMFACTDSACQHGADAPAHQSPIIATVTSNV